MIKPDMRDPFRPPAVPVMVRCLHCGAVFMSSEMVYERRGRDTLWWCKNPLCGGAGFRFDLHPVK